MKNMLCCEILGVREDINAQNANLIQFVVTTRFHNNMKSLRSKFLIFGGNVYNVQFNGSQSTVLMENYSFCTVLYVVAH